MIPQFAHHDQRIQIPEGQNTEVSYPYTDARKASMQEFVEIDKNDRNTRDSDLRLRSAKIAFAP